MRRTVTAFLGAVAMVALAGCATSPELSMFAGRSTTVDAPSSVVDRAAAECQHAGGWYDRAAGVCDRRGG